MSKPTDHGTQPEPSPETRPGTKEKMQRQQAEASTEPSGAEDPGSEVEFMRDSDHMKNKQ